MAIDRGGTGGDGDNVDNPYDDDDGGSSGGGFVDRVTGWGDLTLPAALQSFLSNPRGFIIGAVVATILETIFGIVTAFLDALLLVFGGSEPGRLNAPGETLGISDVPVYMASQITKYAGWTGIRVIDAIEALNEPIFAGASIAGPLSPLIVTLVVVVETIAVLWLAQRAVFVAADLLQLGGLTE